MTRLLGFVVHNWPLKLAALGLATLLYGVIILTQDARQIPVTVPIESQNQSPELVVVSNLGEVRDIRYLASDDVPVDSGTFRAVVDLRGVAPRAGTIVLGVTVESTDLRVRAIAWEPRQVTVSVDEFVARSGIEVRPVRDGELPAGFEVRQEVLDVDRVEIRGASADVGRVDRVEAHYQVQPNSLDIDRDVDLIAVDFQGEPIPEIDIDPATVRLQVPVIEDGQTRTVPVAPRTSGDPAPGFELAGIDVTPKAVLLEGDGELLLALQRVETEAIVLTGATEDFERTVELALPADVLAVGDAEVRVTVRLRAVTATRTFSAGVVPQGARSDRTYELSVGAVAVIVGGSTADLDRLEGAAFAVRANVAGLEPGVHDVPLTVDLPAGLGVVSISPGSVSVTVAAADAAASPGASP